MDENNQYGMAMTKPLLYDCIKKKDNRPTMTEFNQILNNLSHEDSVYIAHEAKSRSARGASRHPAL